MESSKSRVVNITKEKLARGVACPLNLSGLGKIPFPYVTAHQYDPRKMLELLHQRSREKFNFQQSNGALVFGKYLLHWTGNAS